MVIPIHQTLLLPKVCGLGNLCEQAVQIHSPGGILLVQRLFRKHGAHFLIARLPWSLHGLSGFAERPSRHELVRRRRDTSIEKQHQQSDPAHRSLLVFCCRSWKRGQKARSAGGLVTTSHHANSAPSNSDRASARNNNRLEAVSGTAGICGWQRRYRIGYRSVSHPIPLRRCAREGEAASCRGLVMGGGSGTAEGRGRSVPRLDGVLSGDGGSAALAPSPQSHGLPPLDPIPDEGADDQHGKRQQPNIPTCPEHRVVHDCASSEFGTW